MKRQVSFPVLTAEEAVTLIKDQDTVAFSGFSPAGAAKVVPRALAEYARQEHTKGNPYKVKVLTGASTDSSIDDNLAEAKAISWRAPYQSASLLRQQINGQEVEFVDMHLSHVPQAVAFGFLGKIDVAVVEATEVTPDGRVFLTTSIGASPSYLRYADRVIIEINARQSPRLREISDIFIMPLPPYRSPIHIFDPLSRIGWSYASVDPKKIVAVVESDEPDQVKEFAPPDENGRRIADHVVRFLLDEMSAGRIPDNFLPLQAGVGNLANSVMAALGVHPDIPDFKMYSEVFQDAMLDLMLQGKLQAASATSLTLSPPKMQQVVNDFDFFASRIVLRPQEISNNPGIIRRLGVVAINTALEIDLYGNVNSSHVLGMDIMNGIGGSGEFTRNSYLSILMAPSTAKGGKISTIVPMCPHIDNNEHSVQVVVTEKGLADLRGLGPVQRARLIIERCAHPLYQDYLYEYTAKARASHISHDLGSCFDLHRNLLRFGTMLPQG